MLGSINGCPADVLFKINGRANSMYVLDTLNESVSILALTAEFPSFDVASSTALKIFFSLLIPSFILGNMKKHALDSNSL